MIITSSHPDAYRYKAFLVSQWVTRLVRLDTETRDSTRVDGQLNNVTGFVDAVYYLPPGKDEWGKIDG